LFHSFISIFCFAVVAFAINAVRGYGSKSTRISLHYNINEKLEAQNSATKVALTKINS
jgi:hypothetical protein